MHHHHATNVPTVTFIGLPYPCPRWTPEESYTTHFALCLNASQNEKRYAALTAKKKPGEHTGHYSIRLSWALGLSLPFFERIFYRIIKGYIGSMISSLRHILQYLTFLTR